MSDAPHESPIKTPKQLITVIVGAFLIPIIVILLLVSYVVNQPKPGEGSDALTAASIDTRIAPVAQLVLVDANAPKVLKSGQEVFDAVCSTCHGAGIAGAPKFGDEAAWSDRIKQGVNVLWDHALKGFQGKAGVMPAKGGNPDLDDIEVERAVVYMANAGGAKFTDPPVPTASATPPAVPPVAATPVATAPATAVPAPAPAPAPTAAPVAVAAAAATDPGKTLFESVCTACHGMGIAGSPKFGDKAAWAPRIQQGLDVLYTHAIHGFQGKAGVMPAKGGSSASDDDVKAAVRYMVNAAK